MAGKLLQWPNCARSTNGETARLGSLGNTATVQEQSVTVPEQQPAKTSKRARTTDEIFGSGPFVFYDEEIEITFAAEPERRHVYDRYGELIDAIYWKRTELDSLEVQAQIEREKIDPWLKEHRADKQVVIVGNTWQTGFKPVPRKRAVSVAAVYKAVGIRKLLKHATLTVKALEALFDGNKSRASQYITETRAGERGVYGASNKPWMIE